MSAAERPPPTRLQGVRSPRIRRRYFASKSALSAGRGVEGEPGDAVVAAVADIEEPCRWLDLAYFSDEGRCSVTAYREPNSYSGTVLGFFWSATMNTRSLTRWSVLGFREVEWIAPGGS